MILITEPAYAALSAPQRAVLAVQARHAGRRPDPRVLMMPAAQRAEFNRLYSDAARANVRLARLIRKLHVQAQQERLALCAWIEQACHAADLFELGLAIGKGDDPVAHVLEGGLPLACPVDLDDLDETPAGRRAHVLKGLRLRLVGVVDRAYATGALIKVIQGELGADPLHPDLRALLDEAEAIAEEALWDTEPWVGGWLNVYDEHADTDVDRIFEGVA
jgi:hypothetical protein